MARAWMRRRATVIRPISIARDRGPEHPAIGQANLRPFVKAQRAQALRLFGHQRGPIDRSDSGITAQWKFIERHSRPAAIAQPLMQVVRNWIDRGQRAKRPNPALLPAQRAG
jgi:glycerol-3-phosphate O-acyltransferase